MEGEETFLFIGGPADGTRRDLRDSALQHIVRTTDGNIVYERAMLEGYTGKPGEYVVERAEFFRPRGMTDTAAVLRLIDHYKPV